MKKTKTGKKETGTGTLKLVLRGQKFGLLVSELVVGGHDNVCIFVLNILPFFYRGPPI